MTCSEETRQLLNLYMPIRERMTRTEREWIDDALKLRTDCEIRDAINYCRNKIDGINRTHMEKEA